MSEDTCVHTAGRQEEGVAACAEELFREYAPYLRMVVRRQLTARLRTRFDSQDVVQSVWADTLLRFRGEEMSWRFRDPARLRSFLVRLTRNRLVDFIRKHRRSLSCERPLDPGQAHALDDEGRGGRVSEQLRIDETWVRLLTLCPPPHRELLRLRRAGASLSELAAATELHPSSVRRILYELAARFADLENDPRAGVVPTPAN